MTEPLNAVRIVPLDSVTLPFNGEVAANSIKTLVSGHITFPFTTEEFRAHFALNTNKKLRLRFFISSDDSAPTALPVGGQSIFLPVGQVDYLVGDDSTVTVKYRVQIDQSGTYLKVVAENTDSYLHTIDAYVEISRKV